MKNFQIKAAFAAILISISATFTACDNDDDVVPAAEITITAPEEGGIVNAGQSVAITGTIAGNTEIHGYSITVRQKSDNKVLFSKAIDAHEKDFAINETWAVDTVAKYKELELEVLATLDHDGKTQSKKITVYALPAGQENHAIITITSPTANAVVLKNTNLNITGSINAIATVHGFTYKIHPQGDTTTLFKKTVHIHDKNIAIAETWPVPAVTTPTNYDLEVLAILDHSGNTTNKIVNFTAKP